MLTFTEPAVAAASPEVIILSAHPLVARDITTLRNSTTTRAKFRRAMDRVTTLVMFEASRDLPLAPCAVHTPMGEAQGHYLRNEIVLALILRAGLAMVNPILKFFPKARIGHIGTRRNEDTAQPEPYYSNLPKMPANAVVFLLDPMLATGGSACDAIDRLKAGGATSIRLLSIIAAPEGVARVNTEHPDVRIFTAALDKSLNEKYYIVPGLGDAGDRYFGTEAGE